MSRPAGLGSSQQLCESAILYPVQDSGCDNETTGSCNRYSTGVACEGMVSETCEHVGGATCSHPKQRTCDVGGVQNTRTKEKPKMESVCLEDLWSNRLSLLGWSSRAAAAVPHSLAKSTIDQYNRCVNRLQDFCVIRGVSFPPDQDATGIIADFLCGIADNSLRPESQLKVSVAAISALYESLGLTNPCSVGEISRLVTGLIKTGTTKPARRTESMPVEPFARMFESWPDNELLSIKDLRLKCITLVALNFMARPSDLAPRGVVFDPVSGQYCQIFLRRDQVLFHEDGSMTMVFFGIKNDTSRSGFEVRIPGSVVAKLDPVRALRCYVQRTDNGSSDVQPLFVSLRPPHAAIKAGTIANILLKAIERAGLGGKGFSAKCFRPTGANAAIDSNCKPETAMQIGRWKTKEVFLDHYVYPRAPADYTDNVLAYRGLKY